MKIVLGKMKMIKVQILHLKLMKCYKIRVLITLANFNLAHFCQLKIRSYFNLKNNLHLLINLCHLIIFYQNCLKINDLKILFFYYYFITKSLFLFLYIKTIYSLYVILIVNNHYFFTKFLIYYLFNILGDTCMISFIFLYL